MSRHALHAEKRSFRVIGLLSLSGPLLVAVLLSLVLGRSDTLAKPKLTFAVPVPVYEIEAYGGMDYNHHASLLNLELGQPGAPQAPIPVDTDGDLLPDVTVAVNLINIDGAFNNPPQPGQILAPNIQINRLLTANVLSQQSWPLRIQVKLTIKDVLGSNPDTIARFGYDTGPGGSIPEFWKATVGGLDNFFNPVTATIDTTGQQLGLHPGISDFRLGPIAAPYQGPLKIIGGVEMGTTKANFGLAYRPFPNAIGLSYSNDANGQHIAYAHGVSTEVDMTATANLQTASGTTNATARIDRVPRSMKIDLKQDSTGGSIDFNSTPDKRLPDIQADVTSTSSGKTLVARADVEALPKSMHGEWSVNNGQPAHVAFNASGTGVGAIEARVANYTGNPTKLVPWVPTQQQYASYQSVPITGGTEQLIMGRAERLRNMNFDQVGLGYKGHVGIGDGELPFVANIGLDQGAGGMNVSAQAQIAPLPDSIDLAFSPPGTNQDTDPLKVSYDASQTTDIDAHVEIKLPTAAASAVCGNKDTICADFKGRNIPTHIEARVKDGLHTAGGLAESRIELDSIPRPGGVQPDFTADVTLGQDDRAPLIAHAELDGLSKYVRIRTVQGADETLQRFELHMCDYNYSTFACATGTEDEVAAVRANVHNFRVRPVNLPPPASAAPLFAGVTARGDSVFPDVVRFEAVARVTHIKELQYINDGTAFGARARIGGGKNLVVDADIKGITMPQIPNNKIDLDAHVLINPLPDTINVCLQNSGNTLVTGTDPVLSPCQQAQPFDDQTLTKTPIVFNWDASTAFSTTASARIHLDRGTASPSDDLSAGGKIQIDHIPSKLNATVNVPTDGNSGPIRVRTTGPPGSNIDVTAHADMLIGGASCNDPNPSHDVACGDLLIDDLPTNMSMLFDPIKNATRAEFHACDYRFYAPVPACKAGTAGEIGVVQVDAHLVKGNPGGSLGVLEPTTDQHVFLQYRQKSVNDLALRLRARFEKIRNVFFIQAADGFDAGYDMGTGVKPFEAKVQADTRTGVLPDANGLKANAELLITPLPAQITVGVHGPGDGNNAAPMVMHYDASSPIRVQAHAQVFRAAAGNSAACGDDGTACATLDILRVPAHMQVTVGQKETPAVGGGVDHQTVVDFASDAPIGAKPDVTVNAIVGLPSTTPLVGAVPIRAYAQLLGLPRYLTVHMDEHVTNPGATNEQKDLRRVTIRTCQLNASDACVAGTEDALNSLEIRAQNFLVRPVGFPAPNAGIHQPLWASIYGRGTKFQAAVHLTNIREATYVNHQGQSTKGFRVRVGSNQNLQARVDIKGLPLGNLNFGNMAVYDATLDARANVEIKPLPDDISICMRESGKVVVSPSGDPITTDCENTAPFPGVGTVGHTPMSVAYNASVPITAVETTLDVALNGKKTASGPAIAARKLHGELNITNIPKRIVAHILTPASDANGNSVGDTRVLYDAPSATGTGIGIHFRAEQTEGDSVCQDPRPSATATCVGADLSNLPNHMELTYQPDLLSNNFHAKTTGYAGKMNFTNLELSSVKPKLDGSNNPIPGKSEALVATGSIIGMDNNITVDGNINMPHDPNKAGSIDLTASVRIDQINATVQNYVAPDPFTAPIPTRNVYKDPASPGVLNSFTVRARPLPDGSPVFKAEVAIKNVAGFGYHQISDNTGAPTGTSVINVDFGKDFAARAYADVVLADGTAIRGDVLLEHIPAGLQFCFRGSRPASTPAPAAGQPNVWCDNTTDTKPEDGAFQFLGTPANPGLTGLDVDAFVRMAAPGGTDIVSGRINITGIPYRIDAILPSEDNGGRLDIAGKTFAGAPLGIKQIKFHAASFDFPSGTGDLQSGYASPTPGFVPITNQSDPFPVTTASTQFTSAVASGDPSSGPFDFEAAGRLGDANDSVSSSRLQRIYSSATACTNRDNRPDFPLLPTNDNVSTYRCIGADLQQTNAAVPDPFALSVIYKTADGKIVRLRNAGINDLPAFFQVNVAKTALVQGSNDALRRRCGNVADETTRYNALPSADITQAQAAATITDCMPPLIRFDQPLSSARLFGVAEFGTPGDLEALADLQPKEALADLDAIPRGDGWGAITGDTDALKGIRAKALTTASGRTAARVSFRLPIPQSVTVDQVQTASAHGQADKDHYFDSSDLRFHYVVRDAAGNTVPNLGELSALYQSEDGSQVLLGAPCQLNPHERVSNNSFGSFDINNPYSCNADWRHGLLIPGEIGISMYTRNNLGTGQKYIQIDGRLSTDVSAAVRMIGNDPTGAGRVEAEIKSAPGPLDKNGNADPNVGPEDATFRIAFLDKGKPQTPPDATPPAPPSPPSECVLCVTSNIRLAQAFVSFNFWPDHSKDKARRVEATLNSDGAKNGLELHSYNQVKGGSNAAVQAQAYLEVNPLDISFYLNLAPTLEALGQQAVDWVVDALDLPGWVSDILGFVVKAIADFLADLVNLDATLRSRLDASVDVKTSHLTLRQNILHVKVKNMGAASDGTGNAQIGPIDWYVQELKANANLGFTIHTPWPFPDINIGLTLLTVYYVPVAYNIVPFLFKYLNCSGNFWDIASDILPPVPGETITAGPGATKDVVIWPLWEPRLQLGGIIGGIINAATLGFSPLRNLAGLFFCIPGADDGDVPLGPPGDTFQTVAGGLWPQHPIFDSDAMADSVLTAGAPGGIGAPPAIVTPPTPDPVPPVPAPNGPNYTVFAGTTLAMCGVHAFGDLTLQSGSPGGTIKVASAADGSNPTGTGANCAAADVGKLIITADTITNHGVIDGNAAQATQPQVGTPAVTLGTPATGNHGAGHGGAGGAGSTGTGGNAYSKTSNADPEKNGAITEPGAPGGAISGSKPAGGGEILLLANDSIVSDGTIMADGDNGVGNTTGSCAFDTTVANVPPPGTHVVHTANSGVAAQSGAGSGGGVVVSAPMIDLRGTTNAEFHANGGVGGQSKKAGSGGGGGGVVKLLGPIQLFDAGFTPGVGGGAGGTNLCAGLDVPSSESTAGSAGAAGVVIRIATPQTRASSPAAFWNNGSSITVPFAAKAGYQNAGGYQVVLCGIQSTTTTAPAGGTLFDRFTVPASNSVSNPCGAGATALTTKTIGSGVANADLEVGDANATITFSRTGAANNGIWGLYTVVVRPNVSCAGSPPDCAVSGLPQPQYDAGTAMTIPAKVDTVIGIDNSNPTVSITAPTAGFLTKTVGVTLSFTSADQDTPASSALSHIVKTECRNSAPSTTAYVSCASGNTFNLVPGNGAKTIQVRVTDGAGNTATSSVSGILSNSPPTATATIQNAPNGSAGWYTVAPTITLSGYTQGDGVPAEASVDANTGPYRWRFDNLPENVCTVTPCVVPASAIAALPAGTHTFSFAAVDALGNRLYGSAMQSTVQVPSSSSITSFKWDPDKPTTQLDTVPLAPDKTVSGLGWYTTRPFVVLSALDALGGSGLNLVRYRIDGIGSFLTYSNTNPPQLTPGTHTVEYFSTDVAGNIESTHVSTTIRVDDQAPDSNISVSGGVLGLGGWYTTPPTVVFNGFDDHGLTGAPASGALRYRVDNGDEVQCNNPCNLAPLVTGTHIVGLYAVDAAGNAHTEAGVTIKVDTLKPHTTVAIHSPTPDGLNGWFLSLPYIELGADDQPADYDNVLPYGSGVDKIQYQLDGTAGTWLTYTGSFQIAGSHTICYRSIDVAGNTEAATCTAPVKGDDKDPTTALSVAGTSGLNNWYLNDATVTVTASDPVPGSGLVQPGATGSPCYDAIPAAPVPAGTCVSIDGRPFARMVAGGQYVLGEGVHTVLAYSVDAAGHKSTVVTTTVRVDKSAPYTTARTLPPYSAHNGWFRAVPRVVLRAADGDSSTAGVAATYYKIDSGAFQQYTAPFDIGNGQHTVSYYSVDLAGRQEATKLLALQVDTTPPIAAAVAGSPSVWLKVLSGLGNVLGLSPKQAKLQWIIGDDYSSKLTVRVLVYDITGNVVRQLECVPVGTTPQCYLYRPAQSDLGVNNPIGVTPGVYRGGYTLWDGKDQSLTGLVPVGIYFFRVIVTDDAGNVAQSGESKPIQIKVG